mmetsp:Transcript_10188/g.9875  ORF Transcript_10188/g.9875 Transcript_10188/m.9875 type:complete len:253 (-) Transcript_10188:64-822(-)
MEFMNNYVTFMLRPFEDTTVTGISVFPEFWNVTLLFTVAFSALYSIVPYMLSNSSWYLKLEPTKRKELPTYLISFVHHLYVVPYAWLHIYQDYLMVQSGAPVPNDHYAVLESYVLAFGCAYIFADIICAALPDALHGKPLYMYHHVFTIALGVGVMYVPGSYTRTVPHFLICETTNIFFNFAWVLRAMGFKNFMVTIIEILFAISFFPIRIINLTLVLWLLQTQVYKKCTYLYEKCTYLCKKCTYLYKKCKF